MTTNTNVLNHETSVAVSSLMQNLPIPLGGTLHTRTQDYDKERFFMLLTKNVSALGHSAQPSLYFLLFNKLNTSLKGWGKQELSLNIDKIIKDSSEHLTFSISKWVYDFDDTHIIPLQFIVFKTQISPQILHFCAEEGILRYLRIALDLAEKIFISIPKLSIEIEQDPDTGEQWLMLDITIEGSVDQVLTEYDSYVDHWVSLVPWPERDKIRLSYNII